MTKGEISAFIDTISPTGPGGVIKIKKVLRELLKQKKEGEVVTVEELEEALLEKQDTLVSGENVKTVGGQSIVGKGNIEVGDKDAIKFVLQQLTEAQKAQARANIDAYKKPSTGIPASDIANGVIPDISGKQDTITDLQEIRSGAAAGATAVQPSALNSKQDVISDLPVIRSGAALGSTSVQPAEFNELKDEVDTIGNGAYEEAWDGDSTPVVADIPAGVVVTYGSASYTGTLAASASTVDKIYLVSDGNGNYDRYTTVEANGAYSWKKVGSTAIPLSNYATRTQVSQLLLQLTDLDEELHTINPHITGRMGMANNNDDITVTDLLEYTGQYGVITITSGSDGYLWCCLENDHFRVTSYGVEIPMVYVKEEGNLHCFVSAEKIKAGVLKFVVEGIHPIKADTERVIITASSYTITYGDAIPEFGFIADAEVEGTPSITCEAVQGSNVGTYDIVISRGTVEDDNAIYVNGTLTIVKAELVVTADNKQVEVGGTMPTFTVSYEGFVLGEDESVLTTIPICTTTAEDTDTEGEYPITPSGAVSANYSFEYVAGELRIGDPVIASFTSDEVLAGGNVGGYINTTTGKWAVDSQARWYGTIVDVRNLRGNTLRLSRNMVNFGTARYAFLTAPTFANGNTPSYVSGVSNVTDFIYDNHGVDYVDIIVPNDANYLYVYTYSNGATAAPGLTIYGQSPNIVVRNLVASLFATKTTIGENGTVYTGSSANTTVCSDYLDTTSYSREKTLKFRLNNLPNGVDSIQVCVAEYNGNKKFIRRDSYKTIPAEYEPTPSTAYIRVIVACIANGAALEGNVVRFDNDDIQTEGQ